MAEVSETQGAVFQPTAMDGESAKAQELFSGPVTPASSGF